MGDQFLLGEKTLPFLKQVFHGVTEPPVNLGMQRQLGVRVMQKSLVQQRDRGRSIIINRHRGL